MSDTNDDSFEKKVVFVEVRVAPLCGGHGYQKGGFESQKYTPWVHWGHRCRFCTIGIYQKELIFNTRK